MTWASRRTVRCALRARTRRRMSRAGVLVLSGNCPATSCSMWNILARREPVYLLAARTTSTIWGPGWKVSGWGSQRDQPLSGPDDRVPEYAGGQSFCRIHQGSQQHPRQQLRPDFVSTVAVALSAVHWSHYGTTDDWQFHLSRVAIAGGEKVLERA